LFWDLFEKITLIDFDGGHWLAEDATQSNQTCKKDKKDFWTLFHCERFPAQLSCVASRWQRHLWVLRSLP
jgi:hypothetical protein